MDPPLHVVSAEQELTLVMAEAKFNDLIDVHASSFYILEFLFPSLSYVPCI